MPRYLASLLAASALFFSTYVQAQEFRASVNVNVEQLPINQRDDIATMQNDVSGYYQNQRFTGADWEGARIPIDVTIYIAAIRRACFTTCARTATMVCRRRC
jgi:hypothetical protein